MKSAWDAILIIAFAMFFFFGGYALCAIHTEIDKAVDCGSYTHKHIKWEGYWGLNQYNEHRCFWVETAYPYRVKHGVIK